MENYYDILEVSEKASDEVIEKAYKVLVKKYHPDLQEEQNKSKAEEMMKKINEAYDVLSNPEKRAEYDANLELEKQRINRESNNQQTYTDEVNYGGQYTYNQNRNYGNQQTYNQNTNYNNSSYENSQVNQYNQYEVQQQYEDEYRRRMQEQLNKEAYERQIRNQQYELKYRQQMQNKINQEYENAYYNYLRSLGYKIKEKWTFKKFLLLIEVIAILTVAIIALWFFPPTNKLLMAFYEGNPIIKGIIDTIIAFVQVIWNAVYNLFANPPQL